MRWPDFLPLDASIGLTPARAAKAALDRSRAGLSPAAMRSAAEVSGPTPGISSRAGFDWAVSCSICSRSRARSSRRPSHCLARVRMAVFVALATSPMLSDGRQAAALRARLSAESPVMSTRIASGAVIVRWSSWPWNRVICSRIDRSARRSTRRHSTIPSRDFGVLVACPARTARAAASASTVSDFPFERRSCRLGRFTSTTSWPAACSTRCRPSPYVPVPSTPTPATWPWPDSHRSSRRRPSGLVGNDFVPSSRPVPSTTAATCTSRCVSTPP